jgi:APA family basic amino acid/polyamine antiporter
LVGGCFWSGPSQAVSTLQSPFMQGGLAFGLLKSLQLIMGSYDGWMSVSFFAEEDQNASKNIPKSYLLGALVVALIYALINAAILYVLPVSIIAHSQLAAAEAAHVAFGNWGSRLIIVISLFSLVSILNAYILIPPRILFGLSRDGFFLKQGALVNKGGTPFVASLICYIIAAALILLSSFEQLFALGAFLMTIVTAFGFASLIRLRKKEPALDRPYKAWGYPYTTYFLVLVTLALLVGFALSDLVSLFIALGLVICSYPAYKFLVQDKQGETPKGMLQNAVIES